MNTTWSLLLAVSIILLTKIVLLHGSFTLKVHLNRYRSAKSAKLNGFCCDGTSDCMAECNNQFNFCLRLFTTTNSSGCNFGEIQTPYISDDQMTFPAGQNLSIDIPNPLVFHGDIWPGSVELIVRVDDELTGSEDNQNPLVVEFPIALNISHDPSSMEISTVANMVYDDGLGQGKYIELNYELECDVNFYGSNCGVFCETVDDDDLGHFTCDSSGKIVCLDGFTDISTNCTECVISEGCSSVGGFCNSTDRCICREEYGGENCEIDLNVCRTDPNTCQNGGSCVYNQTVLERFVCSCTEGYGGSTCNIDLDVCGHSSPCQNNAICDNSAPDNYTCFCVDGFEGRGCDLETDECVQNMCQNGAICKVCSHVMAGLGGCNQNSPNCTECSKDLHLNYECECSHGYRGRNCEIEIDGCLGQTCQNNGTCQNRLGSYVCLCTEGFYGRNCENMEPAGQPDTGLIPIISGSIASGVLLMIIAILFVVIIYILLQRKRRKLVTNTFKEAGDPSASSQKSFSVDNPTFIDFDATNQVDGNPPDERFDNPIYAQAGQTVPTDGHYSRLNSRMGNVTNGQPNVLAPTSSSVVDLLNSIADYSTLDDSMRTQSTTVSSVRDHQYEQIGGEGFSKSHILSSSPDLNGDHEYSKLTQKFTEKLSAHALQHNYDQPEGEEVKTEVEGVGLPHPYENLSGSNSPDGEATDHAKYDCLMLKSERDQKEASLPVAAGDLEMEVPAICDYDSVECGVYENTDQIKENLETVQPEDTPTAIQSVYDDILP